MKDLIVNYAKGQLELLKRIIERSKGVSLLVDGEDLSYQKEISRALPEYVEKFPGKASDIMEIDPKGENIGIDEIRSIKDFLNYSPELYLRKYVIVHDCDKMTQQAANAFLKTLEEPPEYAVIILNTKRWHYLLPTIRSRVFRVSVRVPRNFLDSLKEKLGEIWEEVSFLERDFQIALEAYKLEKSGVLKLLENTRHLETDKLLKKILLEGLEGYVACLELLRRFVEVETKTFFEIFDKLTNAVTGKDMFLLIQKLVRIVLYRNDWEDSSAQRDISFLDSILRTRVANLNSRITLMNILIIHRERKRGVNSWS
ncbi:DNA polymerase III subunit delta' [Thermotoga sp. KOL6]|uniref:DNA polymerase III subunit delta' n=1 Tax=Thermotoga sp. KOL6 TaxID=126741 RepID=UPI000C78B671|nr:DNA polymerase III subunit delta' [Thermotoga sp. KOL6]PLV59469.1 DNA polymerase III subunit gamma/tau [Thermotoga sp. KOL6]